MTKHGIYRRLNKFPEYTEIAGEQRRSKRERAEEAIKLLEEGFTTDEIMEICGWEKNALYSVLHRRGVKITRSKFEPESAWKLFKQGLSTHAIAKKYGVARITVARNFRALHPDEYNEEAGSRKGGRKQGTKLGNSFDVAAAFAEYCSGPTSLRKIAPSYGVTMAGLIGAFQVHFPEEYAEVAKTKLARHRKRALVVTRRRPFARPKGEPVE